VGEQIVDGDGAFGGHDAQPTVGSRAGFGDGGLLERRDKVTDGFGEADPAFLHQHEDGRAGESLGLRSDAENGVRRHAAAGFFVGPPEGALVDGLAILEEQDHGAGDAVLLHVAIEQCVEAPQAFSGDAVRGSRLGGRSCRAAEHERSNESPA
jgi:hypothetical protein